MHIASLFIGFGAGLTWAYRQSFKEAISNLLCRRHCQPALSSALPTPPSTNQAQQLASDYLQSLSDEELQNQAKRVIMRCNKQFEASRVLEYIIERDISADTQIGKQARHFEYTRDDLKQADLVQALCTPIWDMLSRGGKRIRPVICALIAESFGHSHLDLIEIAGFIEVLHNSSLIIDDIEDNSITRREKSAIHILYGVGLSINAGNYAYFAPFNYLMNSPKFSETQQIRLAKIYAEEMMQIHYGQAWDILWQNIQSETSSSSTSLFPTETRYLQMIVHKTGVLFRILARMTCVALELDLTIEKSLTKFTEKIGAAFQIQDDLLNIDSANYITKSYRGEDIYEGKVTLMVIHALDHLKEQEKHRLLLILKMKTKDQELIDEAIQLIRSCGSIEYAKVFADKLVKEAWSELDKCLPESQAKKDLLVVCQFVIKRSN